MHFPTRSVLLVAILGEAIGRSVVVQAYKPLSMHIPGCLHDQVSPLGCTSQSPICIVVGVGSIRGSVVLLGLIAPAHTLVLYLAGY